MLPYGKDTFTKAMHTKLKKLNKPCEFIQPVLKYKTDYTNVTVEIEGKAWFEYASLEFKYYVTWVYILKHMSVFEK